MDCRQIEELMMEYLYQELDAAQSTAYRAHLSSCPQCAAQLAGYERTRQAVRSLPDMDPPAAVTARLLHEAASRRPVQAVEAVAAGMTVGGGRVVRAAGEGKGAWAWLTGWMQPIFAHPGFAAAAGLVVVGGIAGFLAMRGKFDTAATARMESAAAPSVVPEPTTATAPTASEDQLKLARQAGEKVEAFLGSEGVPAPGAVAPANEPEAAPKPGRTRLASPQEEQQLGHGGVAAGKAPDGRRGRAKSAGVIGGTVSEGGASKDDGLDVGAFARDERSDKNVAPAPAAPPPPPALAAPRKPAPEPVVLDKKPREEQPRPVTTSPSGVASGAGAGGAAGPTGESAKKKESKQAPAPTAHRSQAARPAQNESLDADAESAGAAPPPSAAPPATMADEAAAPSDSAKSKAKPNAQEAEARKLHGQARAKANTGNCGEALKLRDRISKIDPSYFDRSVKNDADLARCSTAQRKAGGSGSKAPAAPAKNDAPAVDKAK